MRQFKFYSELIVNNVMKFVICGLQNEEIILRCIFLSTHRNT